MDNYSVLLLTNHIFSEKVINLIQITINNRFQICQSQIVKQRKSLLMYKPMLLSTNIGINNILILLIMH